MAGMKKMKKGWYEKRKRNLNPNPETVTHRAGVSALKLLKLLKLAAYHTPRLIPKL